MPELEGGLRWSQGETEAEAIGNIRDAIAEYQAAVTATFVGEDVREVEVADWQCPGFRASTTDALFVPQIRAGFRVVREGRKHVVMSDGNRFLTIPRNDPINAHTMGGIATDAGLHVEAFGKLL